MSNTLSDKTNKSIADIANKIMQEQPTKIRDFSDTKPIESDMVQRVMNLKVPNHFVKEEVEQIDEALDHEVDKYAKHMLNAHSAEDLHVGNDHRQEAHNTLKHIEKHYGPVGVRWAEARAGEHIENHNKAQREAEKASVMKRYKPTPPGAKVYQYPKSEVKEEAELDEVAKWRTNPKAHDVDTDGSFLTKNSGDFDNLKARETYLSNAKTYINNKIKNAKNARKQTQSYAKSAIKLYPQKEEVEQVDEARFGKAIDPSKLSAAARARLEARAKKAGKEAPKAEPAPTSAAVGKRAGRAAPKAKESPMAALAQSFGAKKKAAQAAPEKEETPAQKVRRQNIERQKEYYAKGGSGRMNVGSGGRTSITGHNTSTAGGAVNAVKSQGRIKTGGLHSVTVDEGLKGNQTKIDVAPPYGKLTAQDFKALRAKHKKGN